MTVGSPRVTRVGRQDPFAASLLGSLKMPGPGNALLITAECEKSFPFMPFELGYEAVPGLAYGCLVRQATENRAQSMKREMLRKCCGWQ